MKSKMNLLFILVSGLWIAPLQAHMQRNSCPAIVENALRITASACEDTGRNQACYGNVTLEAEPQPGVDNLAFVHQGDIADVAGIRSLTLSSMDEEAGEWGVAVMRIQANLPEMLPGQNVSFLMFGNVGIENAVPTNTEPVRVEISARDNMNVRDGPSTGYGIVGSLAAGESATANGRLADGQWLRIELPGGDAGWVFAQLVTSEDDISLLNVADAGDEPPAQAPLQPMQAFYFRSGVGDAPCQEAPDSGILIQTPAGAGEINLIVNEVQITLSSTVYLQAQIPGELVVNGIENGARVRAFDTTQPAVAGTRVRVPLNANAAPSGPPAPPEPYDGQRLLPLPLGNLDRPLSLRPALTQAQIDALLREFPVFQETLSDREDDVLTCDTRVSTADLEVDIVRVVVGRTASGDLVAQVHLRAPLENDYSFAVILNLTYLGGVRRYIWEIHDNEYRIGEINPDTGVVIGSSPAVVQQDGSVVSFFVPLDALPETISQVGVRSFHTPDREMQPQPHNCDTFGLVDIPERLR